MAIYSIYIYTWFIYLFICLFIYLFIYLNLFLYLFSMSLCHQYTAWHWAVQSNLLTKHCTLQESSVKRTCHSLPLVVEVTQKQKSDDLPSRVWSVGRHIDVPGKWVIVYWLAAQWTAQGCWRPECTCKTLNRVMIFKSTSLLLLQLPQWLVMLGLVEDHQKICPDDFRLRSETGMRESMVQTRAGARAWQECIESAQAAWAQSSWQEFS